MSERSLAILPSLETLTQRLRGRRPLVLFAAGGVAAAALFTVWLASSFQPPGEVAVEVALPPPAARGVEDAPPAAATLSGGADPATLARPGPGNVLTVPPVPADAFARAPVAERVAPLPAAPDPALVETGEEGSLPKRGEDGRLPWQAYARPFAASGDRPRIAIIVTGLGTSAIVTREIIRRLPGDVTLAFEPAAADVADWGRQARAAGHEIMLSLPVQGEAFPFLDRGPEALSGDLPLAENRTRLNRFLARAAGYVGLIANAGAEAHAKADAVASPALAIAAEELARRGLLFVTPFPENKADGSVPHLRPDRAIGPDADVAVQERLAELETLAAANAYALAVVEPTPAAAEALAAWAGTLAGKDMVLAPVSAVALAAQGCGR